jgi:hypothetical protein
MGNDVSTDDEAGAELSGLDEVGSAVGELLSSLEVIVTIESPDSLVGETIGDEDAAPEEGWEGASESNEVDAAEAMEEGSGEGWGTGSSTVGADEDAADEGAADEGAADEGAADEDAADDADAEDSWNEDEAAADEGSADSEED